MCAESILRVCEKDSGPRKPQADGKPLTTPVPQSQGIWFSSIIGFFAKFDHLFVSLQKLIFLLFFS